MTYYRKQRMDSFKRAMFASTQISKEPREDQLSKEPEVLADLDWSAWLPRPLTGGSQLAS